MLRFRLPDNSTFTQRFKYSATLLTQVTQLTDEVIKSKLEEIAGTSRSVSVESASADVKRNVRLDSNEPDARLRILMLSASYLKLCEKRGWKFVETSQKAAIKHVISVLQPPNLRNRVEDALQLERADLKNDYFGFMDFLAGKAEIFERVQTLRSYLDSRKRGHEKSHAHRKKATQRSNSSSITGSSSTVRAPPVTKKDLRACLNPACNERHLVKDCPKTTKEQAKQLLESYRAKKNQDRKPSVSILASTVPGTEKKFSTGKKPLAIQLLLKLKSMDLLLHVE